MFLEEIKGLIKILSPRFSCYVEGETLKHSKDLFLLIDFLGSTEIETFKPGLRGITSVQVTLFSKLTVQETLKNLDDLVTILNNSGHRVQRVDQLDAKTYALRLLFVY